MRRGEAQGGGVAGMRGTNASGDVSRELGRLGRLAAQAARVVVLGLIVGAIGLLVILFISPPVRAFVTPQRYVYGDAQTAVLVEWSERSGALDGTFQMANVDAPANVIRVRTSAFSGTHDDSRVTLNFAGAAVGVPAISGTLGWRTLQLDLPQPNGEVAPVRLGAGDLTDYNHAVQALKKAHPDFEIQGN